MTDDEKKKMKEFLTEDNLRYGKGYISHTILNQHKSDRLISEHKPEDYEGIFDSYSIYTKEEGEEECTVKMIRNEKGIKETYERAMIYNQIVGNKTEAEVHDHYLKKRCIGFARLRRSL